MKLMKLKKTYKYERNLTLKPCYFKSKEQLLDFVNNVFNIVQVNPEINKSTLNLQFSNNYGKVSINNIDEFTEIVNESENIYSLRVIIISNEIKLLISLKEFDTFKNKSNIKIYSNHKSIIKNIEEELYAEIDKYKNKFSFVRLAFDSKNIFSL